MTLRSIAELAAYGAFAVLLTAASLSPEPAVQTSSATTVNTVSSDRPAAATRERGALLFATKGCIACHTHAAFPSARMQIGPELTGLPERAAARVPGLDARAYVRQALREPGEYRVPGYTALMPDLQLSDDSIESLVAFLLSPSR